MNAASRRGGSLVPANGYPKSRSWHSPRPRQFPPSIYPRSGAVKCEALDDRRGRAVRVPRSQSRSAWIDATVIAALTGVARNLVRIGTLASVPTARNPTVSQSALALLADSQGWRCNPGAYPADGAPCRPLTRDHPRLLGPGLICRRRARHRLGTESIGVGASNIGPRRTGTLLACTMHEGLDLHGHAYKFGDVGA